MRLLLDTHALLWALEGSPRLSKTARRVLEDGRNEVLVSAVSAWEIAIKKRLGRLEVPGDLESATLDAGFIVKSVGFAEARRLETLPHPHRDPFDRMLVAQALEEGAALVTCDPRLTSYPVAIVW